MIYTMNDEYISFANKGHDSCVNFFYDYIIKNLNIYLRN